MIEFLSCIHLHSEGEDLNEISKTKSIRMVPTLCGMSSTDKYCSSSREKWKPRIIQPSSRTSWPSIKPIVQGRGSEDCAQADGRSEHTVVKQETWLLSQIPPGCIYIRQRDVKEKWSKFKLKSNLIFQYLMMVLITIIAIADAFIIITIIIRACG